MKLYESGLSQIDAYEKLAEIYADVYTEKGEKALLETAQAYRARANALKNTMQSQYPNASGLFSFSELWNASNPYGLTVANNLIESGADAAWGQLFKANRLPIVGKTTGYENATVRISSGAENVALYPKLKEQLKQENLDNIVSRTPILEHAAFGTGNLTVRGTIANKEVERLALEWIGEKPTHTSNGGMISSDGTRRYRPADIKKNSKYAESGVQANFERGYTDSSGKFIPQSNLHLNIKGD